MRFAIGDSAWRSKCDREQDWITCPDCAGQRFLTVVLGSGEQHTIACDACAQGGMIGVYKRSPSAELVTITGAELSRAGVEYRTSGSYCVKDEDLFYFRHDALVRAASRCAIVDQEERERLLQKAKPCKTWAFYVSYHRREAKRLRLEAERHEAALDVARGKAKEDKELSS